MEAKRIKLDYEEITPCLKEVTKVWDEMMRNPGRPEVKFDNDRLLGALKAGTCTSIVSKVLAVFLKY